jgi:hypothetical protein
MSFKRTAAVNGRLTQINGSTGPMAGALVDYAHNETTGNLETITFENDETLAYTFDESLLTGEA